MFLSKVNQEEVTMPRDLSTADVEVIMRAKDSVARSRDMLKDFFRYLKGELSHLERCRQDRRIKEKIDSYKSIVGLIPFVDEAVNEIRKPLSARGPSALKNFSETLAFLIENVNAIKKLIKKFSDNFTHKFKGIHVTCDSLIHNTNYLKVLVV